MTYKILIKGKIIKYNGENDFVFFRSGSLYNFNEKTKFLCHIEKSVIVRVFSKINIFRRIFRLDPRVFAEVDTNVILLTYRGKIFRVDLEQKTAYIEHYFRKTMNNPLYFCVYRNNSNIFTLYGEYFSNQEREEVSVFRRQKGRWEKVYTFEAGMIQHIHNIIFDPTNCCFYIFTGDKDHESNIWKADIEFNHVIKIIGGSQIYRSCFGLIHANTLQYFTDTPLEDNKFVTMDLSTLKLTIVKDIEGPIIYGMNNGNLTFLSTSVEPNSKLKGIKYLLSYGLGPGIKDKFSHLYLLKNDSELIEIATFMKDCLPGGLFQFGTVQPIIVNENYVIFYGMGLKKIDNRSLLLSLEGRIL